MAGETAIRVRVSHTSLIRACLISRFPSCTDHAQAQLRDRPGGEFGMAPMQRAACHQRQTGDKVQSVHHSFSEKKVAHTWHESAPLRSFAVKACLPCFTGTCPTTLPVQKTLTTASSTLRGRACSACRVPCRNSTPAYPWSVIDLSAFAILIVFDCHSLAFAKSPLSAYAAASVPRQFQCLPPSN